MFNQSNFPSPPIAKQKVEKLTKFKITREDNYFWMKDKNNPDVIAYLNEENNYADKVMQSTKKLQKKIYKEIIGRIKEDDISYPMYHNGYYYYNQRKKGLQYPIYLRKATLKSKPEVIFDVNKLANNNKTFVFDDYEISPKNNYAAYSFNNNGSLADYVLKIKDLNKKQDLDFEINKISSYAWTNDNHTLIYTKVDDSLRPYQVIIFDIDTQKSKVIYEEKNKSFSVYVTSSKMPDYIYIYSRSMTSSETRIINANNVYEEPKVFLPRKKNTRYSIITDNNNFYLHYVNNKNLNGKIYRIPKQNYNNKNKWETIVESSKTSIINDIDIVENYLIIEEKENALNKIKVLNLNNKNIDLISFPEEVYDASLIGNLEFKDDKFYYSYSSLNRPNTLYEYNIITRKSKKVKETIIPSGFNPEDYKVERIWAKAKDNTKIPVILVYKKELKKNSNNPTLLYGYGSYGFNTDPYFRNAFFSLIDRGFIFAIAQIRGGSELGEKWYLDGKFLKKKNTFNDFIATMETLINNEYTNPKKLAIMGGSAGGMLVTGVANMRTDLLHTVVALVPFTDVVTTMLDESLPLTTGEYEEWGNPNDEKYFKYMLNYSPYDNITKKHYPHILVTSGINDSQVAFHEPTKYVAKLRALKKDDNILLLKTNMDSGHHGATGLYNQYEEIAFYLSFILKTFDINE